eukprot:TRINITY_DN65308_c1_g1_i1.p1 TRINITY_DN65308_c1_g1~~TRINITY_DN65308_c1_g1_i1.p1  ORF type:complete len:491 (+),score=124.58 TRINITY_DN65308_c1_g1_i1:62-1534(+)
MAAGQEAALKIQGRTGRYSQINGVYEPLSQMHNGRPVWCARSVTSLYIFHTGKARWVVSKTIDDGARCFAFVSDPASSSDPASCGGGVVCCDERNEWNVDPKVSIVPALASTDKFVQLRKSLEGELEKLGLNDPASLKALWKRLDYNGNNIVSLAEIDKLVVELVANQQWPAWLNNKPALMRAYKKTTLKDGNHDDWVQKWEFHALLLNIFWFNKLWAIFDAMNGDDRRMDVREFTQNMGMLGLQLSEAEAAKEFNKIDNNHGGQVLFVEFCAYIRKRVNPDDNPNFDGDIYSGEHCGKVMRQHHGHKATHTHFVTRKSLRAFEEAEQQMKALMADRSKLLDLWHRIDYNGNHIVSLAEIDKLVVEKFPLLNHKPALMRAYKATINATDSNGDSWVQRKEFKKLLGNLFYFNKIFWLFDNVDGDKDRRLTYQEFKNCLTLCAGNKFSEQEMQADFQQVDRNGGGIILFDEFCRYFTHKACPQCMADLVSD